ncbi:MAG: [Clostridia bacterium]|nr:[citrate (pro-3S)-lyase] ligase [Clostridia bacterium]
MDMEVITRFSASARAAWEELLSSFGLVPDSPPDLTALLWDGDALAAAGSLCGNIIKYVAVKSDYQGEGLAPKIVTALRGEAFSRGITHLFLYTKPRNAETFSSLFFYEVAETRDVLLLESEKDGVSKYLSSLPPPEKAENAGCCVMNCNPFTLGHRYLIEQAAKNCDILYVFILSEDKSEFTANDRLLLVKAGVSDLRNVRVYPSGDYLISSATFPNYFLKDRDLTGAAHCMLDIEIFTKYYAPHFGIKRRFVGSEPLSPLTQSYNDALIKNLPERGIEVTVIPRLEKDGVPVSASAVRALLHKGKEEELSRLVPATTLSFLKEKEYI